MKNPLIYIPIGLLKFYQLFLSPVTTFFGARCRHAPSCSSYAITAYKRYGLWTGSWLTLSRLCRCHPWGSSGIDPVPECRHKAPFYAPWRLGDWNWSHRGGGHEQGQDKC